MKVLSVFILLLSAISRGQESSAADPMALMESMASAKTAADNPASVGPDSINVLDVAPLDGTASVSENQSMPTSSALLGASALPPASAVAAVETQPSLTQDAPAANETGNYVPLFDFNLAPYNVALEIVAEALEKLADTMEPLDLPLPLIGPGYYLEVMVKAPKNPHMQSPPPFGQLNPVNIEGGQAPPVTEIDIILPGESEIHQTIILPAVGQSASSTSQEAINEEPVPLESGVSAPVPVVEPETAVTEETAIETETETEAISAPASASETMSSSSDEPDASDALPSFSSSFSTSDADIDTVISIAGPAAASTESTPAPLSETPMSGESSAGSIEQVIVGQFSNSGVFEGHLTGFLSFGNAVPSSSPVSSEEDQIWSENMSADASQVVNTVVSIFGMPGAMSQSTAGASAEESASATAEQSMPDMAMSSVSEPLPATGDIPDIIGGAYFSSDAAQQSSLATEYASEEGQLESETMSSEEMSLAESSEIEGEQSAIESPEEAGFASELDGLAALGPETSAAETAGSVNLFSEPEIEPESESESEQSIVETDIVSSDEGLTLPGLESDFGFASEMPMDTAEMTMASVPLPYPPFGGPDQQQQQPTMPDVSGALTDAASPTADISESAASTSNGSDDVIETINIVGAPNQNALESSIDAILHSVLEEYESESTPKAAVGFALIHARRQAMSSGSAE
ncbi:hypothetical protein FB645_000545 [Coemansia sp. IMI 203386]|nr:hypothetical protein FB645_000545 [Coemansia sp. IMI 203386]